MKKTVCEECANYQYDDTAAIYYCDVELDEDEMGRFLTGHTAACPYYQPANDYEIVKKQI